MTKENTQLLNELLAEFFLDNKFDSPNYFTRNKTASLLKENLSNLGYWRNKARNKNPKLSDKMFVKKFLEKQKKDDCPF